MNAGFTHLHLHSQYSLLDGAIRLHELVPKVKELGMDSVAVTDHGNMFGAVDFYKTAKKHGVKPVMGCEAYVAGPKGRKDRTDRTSAHMVLLAKDNEGYKNLSYLVSMGYLEGFFYKPRIDRELLRKHSKGLYATSACLGGVVNKCFLREGEAAAAEVAKEFKEIFEPGHFFLELQNNGYEEQVRANAALQNIAELYDIPLVATADSHYLTPSDSPAHEILMCIAQGKSLSDFRQSFKHSDELYVKSPQQMYDAFRDINPKAVENAYRISQDCNVELELGTYYLPKFPIPDGYTLESYLEKVSFEGLERRINEARYPIDRAAYKERLEYELGVINSMGFPGYFLVVWDFIRHAQENQIPVGPGRGSGAGSLVAYSLRITDLDPIPNDLIFERFLNPERVSMPDFDIDFCQDRRGEVIDYVSDKYGEDKVGQIVTYSQMSAKGGIKDVGRVMGLPFAEVNELTKLIPNLLNGKKVSIDKALEVEPKLTEIQKEKPIYRDVIDIARALEGLNRQTGMHAAGIVIGDRPLYDFVPMCRGKDGEMVTQFAKDEVEEAGLVKFDFLGLKTLTVVANAVKHVRRREDEGPMGPCRDLDVEGLTFDDPKIFGLIAKGDTDGVFQLESSGFKELLKRLKPDRFEDIVAACALYRPGPLDAGMVEDYVARKHGRKPVTYPHPACEPILKNTYGVIVYQEQVMQIAVALCGFTMGGADKLRKAMGKKKADVMAEMRQMFVDGAFEKSGMPKDEANDLFTQIEKFAGYAFNKSHSAAYSVITYRTAFLKAYFPVEFYAALISTEMRTQENVVRYIASARERGIEILPPDINRSERDFSVVVEDGARKILFGLGAVKGLGDSAIDAVLDAREKDGAFESLFEFCERVSTRKVNKKALEALIKSGAFDDFGKRREQLLGAAESALEVGAAAEKDRESGQTSLFGGFGATSPAGATLQRNEHYPEVPEWSDKMRLAAEKESLGFFVSGHPLDPFATDLPRLASNECAGLVSMAGGGGRFQEASLAGIITEMRERPLKSGNGRMAFVRLEDLSGAVEVLVFSRCFAEYEHVLKSDEPVWIKGAVHIDGDDESGRNVKLRANQVVLLSEVRASQAKGMELEVEVELVDEERLKRLKDLLRRNPGEVPARLRLRQPDRFETVISLPDHLRVNPTEDLLGGVNRLFGKRVVRLS